MRPHYHRFAPAASGGLRIAALASAAILIVTASVGGCGTKIDTLLPDLATKNDRPVMTSAEQKQAIDALIAKRDATAPPQAAAKQPASGTEAKAKKQPLKSDSQADKQADQPAQAQSASK